MTLESQGGWNFSVKGEHEQYHNVHVQYEAIIVEILNEALVSQVASFIALHTQV